MLSEQQWTALKARIADAVATRSHVERGQRYHSDVAELVMEVEALRAEIGRRAPAPIAGDERIVVGGDDAVGHVIGDTLDVGERTL